MHYETSGSRFPERLRNSLGGTMICWHNLHDFTARSFEPDMANRGLIYQVFKYTLYAFLTANAFLFFAEEWAASAHRYADGVAPADIIEGFAATIDTTAWVVLLLMFELETFILQDRHFTPRVTRTLHGLRFVSYVFIVYAFIGYFRKLLFITASVPLAGVSDLCTLVDGTWAYAVNLDEYEILTLANCAGMSAAASFMQFPGLSAAVDPTGFTEISRLAWVDVINSGVWLLVVLVLEIDVRLQERNMLEGRFLRYSNASKFLLYAMLVLAALYWTFKGDFVDTWDAWLWLIAFVFIELNVFDWRKESVEERDAAATFPT
jgi:hypothetical protein